MISSLGHACDRSAAPNNHGPQEIVGFGSPNPEDPKVSELLTTNNHDVWSVSNPNHVLL
jgi:hypothetical protein